MSTAWADSFKATCDALAARFAPGTITTPTGGLAMRPASGQMVKQATALPFTYCEPTDGTIIPNQQWEHHWHIDTVTVFAKRPADPVRVEKQRQIWLPTLLSATEGQMKLGIGAQSGWELKSALPTGWRWAEETIGGEEFDAIRISWDVWVFKTVSLVP